MRKRRSLKSRLWGALWGALLGILLGTACSSAIEPIIKAPWLKGLLVNGIDVGVPRFTTSLGFFEITLGFSFRFTLLSGVFMLGVAALMLFLPFREGK
ncbi:hypothetical protein CEE36_11465 [candidate division TA06 bacterium B3_TA06]|uniref:DUF4321 domain-containing protein n=1 Tax=candidate division TA06 bacterium B3_TA06 TaxID=2012487 RepID=A0A532UNL8_UNCT6|nr:MAG: hypothetical protein CEE36_11465 [candidate division TA06 bacterium B3_TA06]